MSVPAKSATETIQARINENSFKLDKALKAGDITVTDAMKQRTTFMDAIIADIAQEHLGAFAQDSTLIFTGSSGRQELCPYSDNDFFLLFDDKFIDNESPGGLDIAFQTALESLNRALSDHNIGRISIRTIEEATHAACDLRDKNKEIHTQLLDRRFSGWGSKDLLDRLNAQIEQLDDQENITLIEKKFDDYDHDNKTTSAIPSSSATSKRVTVLEPNIKNGYGGLRGYHTMRWSEQAFYNLRDHDKITAYKAEKHKTLSDRDLQSADDAYLFLLTVRYHLHMLSGKEDDVLASHLQPKLAEIMGFNGVEDFMKLIFKPVTRFLTLVKLFVL